MVYTRNYHYDSAKHGALVTFGQGTSFAGRQIYTGSGHWYGRAVKVGSRWAWVNRAQPGVWSVRSGDDWLPTGSIHFVINLVHSGVGSRFKTLAELGDAVAKYHKEVK